MIVNEKRQKLSKRRDKVALEDYLAEGYLPEAMVNYLMLLGWGPGDDREIMPFSEMVPLFRLEDVNSSSAFFDEKKLRAFNGEYIRALDTTEFVERCAPWLGSEKAPWPAENFDAQVFEAVAPLAQTRISVLSEIVSYVDFLFLDRPVEDEKSWAKAMKPGVGEEMLTAALERFSDPNLEWRAEPLKAALEEVAAAQGSSWARPRRRSVSPSLDARWGSPCSSRWNCWAGAGSRSVSARRWRSSKLLVSEPGVGRWSAAPPALPGIRSHLRKMFARVMHGRGERIQRNRSLVSTGVWCNWQHD